MRWRTEEAEDTKHKSRQPHFNERQSLTELRVICTVAGEWLKPTRQPRGLIPIRRNLSRNVEIANVDIREIPHISLVSISSPPLCLFLCSLQSFVIPSFVHLSLPPVSVPLSSPRSYRALQGVVAKSDKQHTGETGTHVCVLQFVK